MRTLLVLALLVLAGCPSNNPPAPVDGGADGGQDGGALPHDGGGHNPELHCSLSAQDCDAGSCINQLVGDGGLGTRCRLGACDLVRQDCPGGSKCTYVTDGGGTFERGCAPEGAVDEGQPCVGTPSSNNCKKGLICSLVSLDDGGTTSVCARFCNSSSGCTSPQICYVLLSIPGTDERPLVCGAPPPSCDLLTQDCTRTQDACYPGSPPSCFTAGPRGAGEACSFSNDCQKGLACVGASVPGTCRALCAYPTGTPSCATGSCVRLSTQQNVGVCQ